MSSIITYTKLSVDSSNNNTFNYRIPTGSYRMDGMECAISNLIIPYDWYSISSFYGNNTFSVKVPVGAGTSTLALVIPDGFYTIDQLNSFLQSKLIANNLYLVNGGDNVYYIEMVPNVNTGKVQLNCYQVPTVLPGGYTNPGWTLPVAVNQVPQLVVGNAAFGDIIGFEVGTYPTLPTQASTYSIQSTKTPEISPVSSVFVCLSIVDNELSTPNNIVGVVPINATYLAQINYQPPELLWIKCLDGSVNNIQLTLYDQNMNRLQLNDTGIVGNILVRRQK
ncbi:MAG: hypothetical protein HGA35_03775 [Erysipelotrichaceae bacterium]|nr:hypothetical protein [Erysipelotrichaceae bacterium]